MNATKLCVPKAVLAQHLVVLGKTGSGKSSVLRHFVEHLLAEGKRVCVIDPKGDWWGLKVAADGKSAGFPVIAFGDFKEETACDIPINAYSGSNVAELIAKGNRPCIIGFRGWTTSAMTQFWIDFAACLFGENAGELYLVCDEFHNFAPKGKILDPKAGMCLHWSNRLLSEGRGLGLVCLMASQRPQKVHNDSLTSAETLIAMRVIHAADRGAVKDWIDGAGDPEQGKKVLNALASMPRGQGYVWSPEAGFGPKLVEFPMFVTFDSFAPPQLQKKISRAGWAEVDLEHVKKELASVIEVAKSNNPEFLRKELADLKTENEQLKAREPTAAPAKIERVEVRTIKKGDLCRLETVTKSLLIGIDKFANRILPGLQEVNANAAETAGKIVAIADIIKAALSATDPAGARKVLGTIDGFNVITDQSLAVVNKTASKPRHAVPDAAEGEVIDASYEIVPEAHEGINAPTQRILDSLAWWKSVGISQPSPGQVAFGARYTQNGSFNQYMSRARREGLIDRIGGKVILRPEGAAKANKPGTSATLAELHNRILGILDAPAQRIVQVLIKAKGGHVSIAAAAEGAGYTENGSFNQYMSRVRRLGLMDRSQGEVWGSEVLFPPGLR